uniref:Uncharacterized protein n=1 Tax=Glossina palpalis gambiensis TaxID=67801 RepID=A0A1B0BQE7_9MUSC
MSTHYLVMQIVSEWNENVDALTTLGCWGRCARTIGRDGDSGVGDGDDDCSNGALLLFRIQQVCK